MSLPARPRVYDERDLDRLTGLLNRVTVSAAITEACLAAGEVPAEGDPEAIAVLYVDIDRLRLVNENHGALFGDQCLRETARRIKESLREFDVAGRIEADDFILVLRALGARSQAHALADHIQNRIAEPVKTGNKTLTIAGYCGVANWALDGRSREELLAAARANMQKKKDEARAQAAFEGKA